MRHIEVMREPIAELAFVPTMGALHDGHVALIKKAKNFGRQVLVSVYVNPTQFESSADLAKYRGPAPQARDHQAFHRVARLGQPGPEAAG